MAIDSVKRVSYAKDAGFQKRVGYWYWVRASQVLDQETPDPDDLAFAKAVYAKKVDKEDMCMTVITNTNIGAALDSDGAIDEDDLEWAVITDNQFNKLAQSYIAAGLI